MESEPTKLKWGDIISIGISGLGEACVKLGEEFRDKKRRQAELRQANNEPEPVDSDDEDAKDRNWSNKFAVFSFQEVFI